MKLGLPQVIKAKTANYTITSGDFGALFTNEGAGGAVVLTLPASATRGAWVEVYVTDNQDVTVATATADTLSVDGDAAADSIGWVTSSHKIGNSARFICLGSTWVCQLYPAATTTTLATQTIVTA